MWKCPPLRTCWPAMSLRNLTDSAGMAKRGGAGRLHSIRCVYESVSKTVPKDIFVPPHGGRLAPRTQYVLYQKTQGNSSPAMTSRCICSRVKFSPHREAMESQENHSNIPHINQCRFAKKATPISDRSKTAYDYPLQHEEPLR